MPKLNKTWKKIAAGVFAFWLICLCGKLAGYGEVVDRFSSGIGSVIGTLFVGGIFLWLYFLPYVTATKRRLKDTSSIGIINLFFGWTLVGWVVAYAWAVSGTAERYEKTETIVPTKIVDEPSQTSPLTAEPDIAELIVTPTPLRENFAIVLVFLVVCASIAWIVYEAEDMPTPISFLPTVGNVLNFQPVKIGDCVDTNIAEIGFRLKNTPGSGTAITYANGIYGNSWQNEQAISSSHVGDPVHLCLVEIEKNCLSGTEGKTYSASNLKTGTSWTLPDSFRACDGAQQVPDFAATKQAAEQGDADAQNKLGVMFDLGEGTEKNDVEAIGWYKKSAEQGYAKAQYNLAQMYRLGKGLPKDLGKATAWYQKSADQGYAPAQTALGVDYHTGQGVQQDDAEAVKWWRKAAEQNNARAEVRLGVAYHEGLGVPKDSAEAVQWWHRAADQNDAEAQYFLGSMYYTGDGVTKDSTEAVTWIQKAADQGNAAAKGMLRLLQKAMNIAASNPNNSQSGKDTTHEASTQQDDPHYYVIPHNKPDASDWGDSDMWFRSCLNNVIRIVLSSGSRFSNLTPDGVKHGSAANIFIYCLHENLDWVDACLQHFGNDPDHCNDLMDQYPSMEYHAVMRGEHQ